MLRSLQGKIVLLYSLLLLFTLQGISVYLVQSLESYYLNNYQLSMESQSKLLSAFLASRLKETQGTALEDIMHLINEFSGWREVEITVLDDYAQVIGSSRRDDIAGRRMIREEVTRALTGTQSSTIRYDPRYNERRFYLAYPVTESGATIGIIYLSGSLRGVDNTLNQIKLLLLTGSGVVLAIGFFLGLIITGTITAPIKEVTRKAGLMAAGDFSQTIEVQSSDEIGQLGQAFNYLAERLNHNMKEISSEKSKVEAIINYMNDGIIALDGQGDIIHINPAARTLLESLVREQVSLNQPGYPVLKELVGDSILNDFMFQPRDMVVEINRTSPTLVIQARLAPFKQEAGAPSGVLVVLHDITKERELVQKQQEFVADVSHELRTPLTTINSYVEALIEGAAEEPEVRDRFLQVVSAETERMVNLVKDLLVLSQLDYSQMEWHKTEVDLGELAREVREQLLRKWGSEAAPIKVEMPEMLPVVWADKERIRQVFVNLLNNALKYTPPEGEITVSAGLEAGLIKVLVADTGVGIPPEDLPHLFERFYRVEKTRSRNYGGTGLGLSIARKIVEAHGGEIWVESEPGKGTRVWFTLPPAKDDERREVVS
ncbi:MAG TPA: ATP-binding protein [Bacillota bacterium]|nr:ATP-binding protein [Bacillota bacterium]